MCAPRCAAAAQGFHANADVALVGVPLSVLDADLSFEVKGPAKSAAEAKKQQQKYAAAKEARRLLGACSYSFGVQTMRHAIQHYSQCPALRARPRQRHWQSFCSAVRGAGCSRGPSHHNSLAAHRPFLPTDPPLLCMLRCCRRAVAAMRTVLLPQG